MADETPKVGQIVEHHFLWVDERAAGQLEGRKSRPCLIVAVEPQADSEHRVTVLPITSQAPRSAGGAVAIPDDVKPRIGLDRSRPAWIVVEEANVFTWPGFDLVPQPNGGFVRGVITRGLFDRVRVALVSSWQNTGSRPVDRD
jgi:hypothetical protein